MMYLRLQEEPPGRTVSGPPRWAARPALTTFETLAPLSPYIQYVLKGVRWTCSRCNVPGALILKSHKTIGYGRHSWFHCAKCKLKAEYGFSRTYQLLAELGIPDPASWLERTLSRARLLGGPEMAAAEELLRQHQRPAGDNPPNPQGPPPS